VVSNDNVCIKFHENWLTDLKYERTD